MLQHESNPPKLRRGCYGLFYITDMIMVEHTLSVHTSYIEIMVESHQFYGKLQHRFKASNTVSIAGTLSVATVEEDLC